MEACPLLKTVVVKPLVLRDTEVMVDPARVRTDVMNESDEVEVMEDDVEDSAVLVNLLVVEVEVLVVVC